MADESVELPKIKDPETTKIRSNNFSHVTTVGNKCVQQLSKVVDQGPEEIVKVVKSVVPELLESVLEVTFEKARLWPVIESDENLTFYQEIDYKSWVSPEDLNAAELHKAKVNLL